VTSKPPHAEKFLKTFCSNNISINDTSSYANIVLNIKRLSIDLLF
jgi:hypothetical protein